jgi:uncharacterized OB-fold protein
LSGQRSGGCRFEPSGEALFLQPPYALGLIDLPEGIRVLSPLKLSEDESYRIGMEMEIYFDELWKEEDQQVIGYKFRPVV